MRNRIRVWGVGVALALGTFGALAESAGTVEIFSWWTTGGEAAGLLRLFDLARKQQAGLEIINATVAGGAGQNAKAVLKTRMLGGDPPDSFQVHMGQELIDTWVVTGYMEPLDDLYRQAGWEQAFPRGVLELLKHDGRYYSVPANIHRANVLWYNTKVFQAAGVAPPKTFDEFFHVAEKLKARGITPLALGDNGIWASTHLFETVLIGAGAEAYKGLWTGTTDWNGPAVKHALETMARMLDYVNSDHAARSWDQANDLVIQGKAGMTIMGDWVDADNLAKRFKDSGWAPAPGNAGIYDALSDTFGVPRKAPHKKEALAWLRLVGSREGQEAFNPLKGSICARTDCDPKLFGPYLRWAMEQWKRDAIVPSLAHGAAAKESWLAAINDAMNLFVTHRDVARAQRMLAQAARDAGAGR
jgi:glucose/mannose transport system substrate-binding protein